MIKAIQNLGSILFLIILVPFLILWLNFGMKWYEKLTGKEAWNPK